MTQTAATAVDPQGKHVFPLLADPAGYVACHWDLCARHAMRNYWLGLFESHFPSLLEEARRVAEADGLAPADVEQRVRQCQLEFNGYLGRLARDPLCDGPLDILRICVVREQVLRRAGFDDPYRLAKARENEVALAALPLLLTELDALDEARRWPTLVQGVFAGNIFDLGATQTAALFQDGRKVDFHATRQKLRPRPWLIDDLDAWMARLSRGPAYRCALLFVDNAGSDVILGMIPLARQFLLSGTRVILTANAMPSLNDVTHEELSAVLDGIARWDAPIGAAMGDGRLALVSSGNGLPLIDLRRVSPELVDATRRHEPDLVVLEGMGRGVESNLYARLTCDAIKVAMIKDVGVAEGLSGRVYDLVFRYDAAE